MPDIAMCTNKECPKRNKCYRYIAKSEPYFQAYCNFKPNKKGECEYFWERKVK